jgi:hypothetical protein
MMRPFHAQFTHLPASGQEAVNGEGNCGEIKAESCVLSARARNVVPVEPRLRYGPAGIGSCYGDQLLRGNELKTIFRTRKVRKIVRDQHGGAHLGGSPGVHPIVDTSAANSVFMGHE